MQAGHKSKPVRLLTGRSLSGTASKSVRTGHRAEFVRTRSGGRLFSVKIVIDAGFFRKKIAEFAIILELNGYSDCLKIR